MAVLAGLLHHLSDIEATDLLFRTHARLSPGGRPVALERLDFRGKKAALEGKSRRYSRMLSSFSYGKTLGCFLSWGHCEGVKIYQVNPAFSSVIGRVKFMDRYGLSVRQLSQSSALAQARRLLRCAERTPALAAHHRLGKCRDDSNPIQAFVWTATRRNCYGTVRIGWCRF